MLKYIIYLMVLLIVVGASKPKPWEFQGTTPKIKDIIIGRCYTFQEISPLNRKESLTVIVDCQKLWQTFKNAWANKDPCNVTAESYEPFFSLVDTKNRTKNQLLFWSGMHRLSGDLGAVNDYFYTLEKTFPGYITNELTWCGCVNDGKTKGCVDGINYRSCKRKDDCSSSDSYWIAASRDFAKKAEGTAYVMLNGTTRGDNKAYRLGSHFRTYELPAIGKYGMVNKLVIFVVFDLGVTPTEKCVTGTIATLIKHAKKKGINKIECIDNPRMIKNLLCVKFPGAKECLGDNYESSFFKLEVFST